MIAAITLVDLDDTLFQTRRKCPQGVDLTPYAFAADGSALSFATPAQVALIGWLEATTHVVAVTARSTNALLRSRLRWSHAIAAHGGVILAGGLDAALRDPAWDAIVRTENAANTLISLHNRIVTDAAAMGFGVRPRIVEEDGWPLYLVVKHALFDGNDAELHAACAPAIAAAAPGWTVHVNGNNVAFLPPGLGKAAAVAWLLPALRRRLPDVPVIGIGDSHTDAAFMALADFAMLPTTSQLATRLFA